MSFSRCGCPDCERELAEENAGTAVAARDREEARDRLEKAGHVLPMPDDDGDGDERDDGERFSDPNFNRSQALLRRAERLLRLVSEHLDRPATGARLARINDECNDLLPSIQEHFGQGPR